MNALQQAMIEAGLVSRGSAARTLGVELELIIRYIDAGAIRYEVLEFKGQQRIGVPVAEVERIRRLMNEAGRR